MNVNDIHTNVPHPLLRKASFRRSAAVMSYYHGLISSRRANSLLTSKPDGSFLLRDSQSQPGNFVLSAK